MSNEEFYDDFIISLTIEGTEYKDIEVKVTNPNLPIKQQIEAIINIFELSKLDNAGRPLQYLLGQIMDDGEEPEILEFEDEDGREQALTDYNIQPSDHLYLSSFPLPGTLFADLFYIQRKRFFSIERVDLMQYGGPHGSFATSTYVRNAIERICQECDLGNPDNYILTKIKRIMYDDIDFEYLFTQDNKYKQIYVDDYFNESDWTLTEQPVLFLLPKTGISKRIYKKLKNIYNGKRRTLR
ncbi:MAG: hypothetical protein HDS13_06880 [Bacteroides sp.]|nr:hypothetical protein [Bacteroides sp.]